MEETAKKTAAPRRGPSPAIIVLLLLLIGGLGVVVAMNQKSGVTQVAHDHDGDGKSDHGDEAADH